MSNSLFDLTEKSTLVVNNLSPSDINYPVVNLENGMKAQSIVFEKISPLLSKIAGAGGTISSAINKSNTTKKWVVDMTKTVSDGVEAGAIKLVEENGKIFAQLRDAKGKYGDKLPIHEETLKSSGVNSSQFVNSLQMMAMQKQLESLMVEVKEISSAVESIYIGQQNDRIASYFTGLFLYSEAQNTIDETFKKLLLAQSLKSFSDCSCKLTLEMQENIKYLKQHKYEKHIFTAKESIEKRISTIQQCFAFTHQSYLMKSALYLEMGEPQAMIKALEEYGGFIKNNVVENAKLLKDYDLSDDGTDTGLWSNRAKLLSSINEVSNSLNSSKEYLLTMKEVLHED